MRQKFNEWLSRHPCKLGELWLIQNCLGSIIGWESPEHIDAKDAWLKKGQEDKEYK